MPGPTGDFRQRRRPRGVAGAKASFRDRVIALFIDGVLLWIGSLAVNGFVPGISPAGGWLLMAAYFTYYWSSAGGGQTLGMRARRLEVVSAGGGETLGMRAGRLEVLPAEGAETLPGARIDLGRAFIRFLVFVVGSYLLGIGLLWAAFGSKQAWHDLVAGTFVVYRGWGEASTAPSRSMGRGLAAVDAAARRMQDARLGVGDAAEASIDVATGEGASTAAQEPESAAEAPPSSQPVGGVAASQRMPSLTMPAIPALDDGYGFVGLVLFALLLVLAGAVAIGLTFADGSLAEPGQLIAGVLAAADAGAILAWLIFARSRRVSDRDAPQPQLLSWALVLVGVLLLGGTVVPAQAVSAASDAASAFSRPSPRSLPPATVAPRTASPAAAGTFTVSGQVSSAATGAPVAGVTVVLVHGGTTPCCTTAYTDTTSPLGRYFFATVAPGTYRVLFNTGRLAPGFGTVWWKNTADFSRTPDVIVQRDVTGVDMALPPGYDVSGVVRGADGPLRGAGVFVYFSTATGTVTFSSFVVSTSSDAAGEYHLRLPDGSYRLGVSPPGTNVVARWWNDKANLSVATPLDVRGVAVGGVDVRLPGPVSPSPSP